MYATKKWYLSLHSCAHQALTVMNHYSRSFRFISAPNWSLSWEEIFISSLNRNHNTYEHSSNSLSTPGKRPPSIHPSIYPSIYTLKGEIHYSHRCPFTTNLLACFNLNDQICSNVTFILPTLYRDREPPNSKNQQSTKPGWWLSLSRSNHISSSPPLLVLIHSIGLIRMVHFECDTYHDDDSCKLKPASVPITNGNYTVTVS